jgi:hypothetical protein
MLTSFTALLPIDSDVEYWALERAAKALRRDPGRYQSVEGVHYRRTDSCLFRWDIEFEDGMVSGLVGLFPLDRLVPHEATTPSARIRPQHPVQIRPVMALVDGALPSPPPLGETVHFHGEHHHAVTPVEPLAVDVAHAVIADGHHRVAAAIRTAEHPLIMTMLVDVRDTPLDAGAFHRVFAAAPTLPEAIDGARVVVEPPRESIGAGRIAVVTPDGSRGVEIAPDVAAELAGLPAGLASRFVLPALGLVEEQAQYVDDIRRALGAVDEGCTAVLLPQSDLTSVLRAAATSTRLPPKSTRFRPKPIRGLLMRPLPV